MWTQTSTARRLSCNGRSWRILARREQGRDTRLLATRGQGRDTRLLATSGQGSATRLLAMASVSVASRCLPWLPRYWPLVPLALTPSLPACPPPPSSSLAVRRSSPSRYTAGTTDCQEASSPGHQRWPLRSAARVQAPGSRVYVCSLGPEPRPGATERRLRRCGGGEEGREGNVDRWYVRGAVGRLAA